MADRYGFSLPEFIKQAAFATVFPPPLFLFQMAGLDQIVDGAFDGAAGEMQLAGDGADGEPALTVLVGVAAADNLLLQLRRVLMAVPGEDTVFRKFMLSRPRFPILLIL